MDLIFSYQHNRIDDGRIERREDRRSPILQFTGELRLDIMIINYYSPARSDDLNF